RIERGAGRRRLLHRDALGGRLGRRVAGDLGGRQVVGGAGLVVVDGAGAARPGHGDVHEGAVGAAAAGGGAGGADDDGETRAGRGRHAEARAIDRGGRRGDGHRDALGGLLGGGRLRALRGGQDVQIARLVVADGAGPPRAVHGDARRAAAAARAGARGGDGHRQAGVGGGDHPEGRVIGGGGRGRRRHRDA